jgi:L-lactate dehydrogenase complex protein LldG
MSGAREKIMGRVATALGKAANETPVCPALPEAVVRQVEAGSVDALWALFARRLEELGDTAVRFASAAEARMWLVDDLKSKHLNEGVYDGDVKGLLQPEDAAWAGIRLEGAMDRGRVLAARFGVTRVDWAIAETGTLVIASGPGRSRLTSLAPEAHYALLPMGRLVADIVDVLGEEGRETDAGARAWITGSSRTADLEGILVHGAHGPKTLTVLAYEGNERNGE